MKAITQERLALSKHVRNEKLTIIKKFIEDHITKNNFLLEKDSNGRTILYDCVHTMNKDILDYFLKLSNTRYKINDIDNNNMTVLDYLLSLETFKDKKPCYDLLIKAGATTNDKFKLAYTGNSYHIHGDLPRWSPIVNNDESNNIKHQIIDHNNNNSNSNNDNNTFYPNMIPHVYWSVFYMIISYIIILLISFITGLNNFNNNNILYINKYEDIKNDLFNVDIIMILLTLLVLTHCFLKTKTNGFLIVLIILGVTLLAEQLSIQLGETHCHFDALVMLSKCSSLNSIIFYIPWMYSCYYIGNRLETRSKLLLIALLHPIYCTMYELTGANEKRWWSWGTVPALLDRFYEVPVITIAFHWFYGLCFALSYKTFFVMKIHNILKVIICIIVTPISACTLLTSFSLFNIISLSNSFLTFLLMLGSTILVIYDIFHSKTKKNIVKKVKDFSDYILFAIPLLFFSFILWSNNIFLELILFDISFIPTYKIVITLNVIVGYIIILNIMYFY